MLDQLALILANPFALALLVVALRIAYAVLSRLVAPYPRARATVEAVAALGPDVLRSVQQGASAVTGRPVASLDLRAPDPVALEWRRRAEAAERRVAELAVAGAPAAPVERVDETTREGRATVAPGTLGMLVLALALASGCASTGTMPEGPATTIRKVQSWWDAVCGTGHAALDLAARTVTVVPSADAGPSPAADSDASAGAPGDASNGGL